MKCEYLCPLATRPNKINLADFWLRAADKDVRRSILG